MQEAEMELCRIFYTGSASLETFAEIVPWFVTVGEVADYCRDPEIRLFARQNAHIIRDSIVRNKLAGIKTASNYRQLEEGAFLFSTLTDPFYTYETFKNSLDVIAEELLAALDGITDNAEKLAIFLNTMFSKNGLKGVYGELPDTEHYLVHEALRTKKGIPVVLSVICLLVAKRAELPLYGTNIPFHFIMEYSAPDCHTYIDPYHGGLLLNREECEKFLAKNGYQNDEKYFSRTATRSILIRLYSNLVYHYHNQGNYHKDEIKQHLEILRKDTVDEI